MSEYRDLEKRITELEKKTTALKEILEEQLGIEIDLRTECEKFLDDFMNS